MRHVEIKTFETGSSEDQGLRLPCAHLAHARVDVAPDLYHAKIRTMMQELRTAPEAGGGDDAPLWQGVHIVAPIRDKDIRRIVALGDRREHDPLWKLRGYVFCGVHRKVYLTDKQCLIELAREYVALVYDGERQIWMVLAGGLDDADLNRKA